MAAKDTLYDLRSFLELLRREKQLIVIDEEVDPHLEIAEIHRRVIERQGPALLFTRVKGSDFSVVTNLFGTAKRLELAFGSKPQQFVRDLVNLTESLMPLKMQTLWEHRHLIQDGLKIGIKEKNRGPSLKTVNCLHALAVCPCLPRGTVTEAPLLPCPSSILSIPEAKDTTLACTVFSVTTILQRASTGRFTREVAIITTRRKNSTSPSP